MRIDTRLDIVLLLVVLWWSIKVLDDSIGRYPIQ
jgi:hypothetical protein